MRGIRERSMDMENVTSVLKSADGPTSIFVAGKTPEIMGALIATVVVGVIIALFGLKNVIIKIPNLRSAAHITHNITAHTATATSIFVISKPALRHTGKIFLYLFVFTFILNLCIEVLGIDRISAMMLGDTVFQPVIAALIGLLPTVRHL